MINVTPFANRTSLSKSQSVGASGETALSNTRSQTLDPGSSAGFEKLIQPMSPVHVSESNILQHSAFHLAYQMITDATYLVPFRVMKRFSKALYQPDCSHPLNFLVEHVSCGMDSGDMYSAGWVRKVITGQAILGNGIGYINRDASGVATEIIPLDANRVFLWYEDLATPVTLQNGQILKRQKFYCIMGDRGLIKMRPENVYHIQNMSCGGKCDWSPRLIDFVGDTLGAGIAAARSVKKFFVNGSQVNGILMIPGHLDWADEEEKDATVKKFRDQYESAENAGKTLVLEEGWKFMKTSADNNSAQLIELRRMSAGDAGRFTRIPAGLIGGDELYSYDTQGQITMRTRSQAYYYWWRQHTEQYNQKILNTEEFRSGEYKVAPDPDDSSLLTMQEKKDVFTPLYDSDLATRAEVKNQFNLEIREGDDVYKSESAPVEPLRIETTAEPEQQEIAEPVVLEAEPVEVVPPALLKSAIAIWQRDVRAGMKRITRELAESSKCQNSLYKFWDKRERKMKAFEDRLESSAEMANVAIEASRSELVASFSPTPKDIIEQVEQLIETVKPDDYRPSMAIEIAEQEITFIGVPDE